LRRLLERSGNHVISVKLFTLPSDFDFYEESFSVASSRDFNADKAIALMSILSRMDWMFIDHLPIISYP
jgi:hypothetical protein